ncbi:MAG TPA: tRNA-binding protein [Actinomycetota bacterium]|nr:tRNA-binding protein [Actinomycetota bacterium]
MQRGELEPEITFEQFEAVDMRVARVISATMAEGTRKPSRHLRLDFGRFGERTSVGQFALIPESELVGRNVIACVNLGTRRIGKYSSEALVLGAPHPSSPADQAQATPMYISNDVEPGSRIF